MNKKILSMRKNYFTLQFYSLSFLGQNDVWTKRPWGKNLKKPILLFASCKTEGHNAFSSLKKRLHQLGFVKKTAH